jgi:hypothetical protein
MNRENWKNLRVKKNHKKKIRRKIKIQKFSINRGCPVFCVNGHFQSL